MSSDVEPRIVSILARQLPNGPDVSGDTNIARDTGLDSVAIMDFVMEVEDTFDISIPLEKTADVETVADLCAVVDAILKGDV